MHLKFSYNIFTMKIIFLSCLILQIMLRNTSNASGFSYSATYNNDDVKYIEDIKIGNLLSVSTSEYMANINFMLRKKWEIYKGHQFRKTFPPSQNFMTARSAIMDSEIFHFIRRMPKGGALHMHEFSMTSASFLFREITFMENLYVCNINGSLSARFFDTPTNDCNWRLLSEVRKNQTLADDINQQIRNKLSMEDLYADLPYPNMNAAWKKYQDIFQFITPILSYRPAFEKYFYHGLKTLYKDNVFYLELRSSLSPLYELNGTLHDDFKVLEIYQSLSNRFMEDYPSFIGVKIIYVPQRFIRQRNPIKYMVRAQELKEKFGDFFGGIDILGQERSPTPFTIYSEHQKIVKTNANSLEPMLKSTNNTGSKKDMTDSVALDPKRIGHGWQFLNNSKHMERLKKLNVAMEICPIANQVLGLVRDLEKHPARSLFENNHPVVVCNDDPGFWGAKGLSYDFYEIFMGLMPIEAGIQDLKKLALNSITHSSMTESEKRRAFILWRRLWLLMINDLRFSEPRAHHHYTKKSTI